MKTLLWMAVPMPHIYHVSEISVVFLHAGFPTTEFSVTRPRKAFHPSFSLRPHAFRGICYTVIFHHPCNPRPTHWRAHFVTCEQWHGLKTLSWHPSEQELSMPWRHILVKNPKNSPFSIGASRQFSTRANGENTSKRPHQLALYPRVALAPTNLRGVF